jgi:predicted DNA-binding transcriptional regulator AlpA
MDVLNHYRRTGGRGPDRSVLLSANELAKLLQLSTRTVWRHRRARLLPPEVRIGRAVRWSRESVELWLVAGCPCQQQNPLNLEIHQ